MPHLIDTYFYAPYLPTSYTPLLEGMREFVQHVKALRMRDDITSDSSEVRDLRVLHDQLRDASLRLLPAHAEHLDLKATRSAFVLGGMRLCHYAETVLPRDTKTQQFEPLLDTCGSRTLSEFEVDFLAEDLTSTGSSLNGTDRDERNPPEQRPGEHAFVAELARAAELEAHEVSRLRDVFQTELVALSHRQGLVSAMRALYLQPKPSKRNAGQGDGASPKDPQAEAIEALFDGLFPGHPLRPGEIEIIVTATSVFFAVPYRQTEKGYALTKETGPPRAVEEHLEVEAFLRRVAHFHQDFYAHFPAFGGFRGEEARPEVLTRLAGETGFSEDEVAQLLTTMISVLPSAKIDQYIIHDAWGHQWQALLFRFEQAYQRLAGYDAPPSISRAHRLFDDEPVDESRTDDGSRTGKSDPERAEVRLLDLLDRSVAAQTQSVEIPWRDWEAWLRAEMSVRMTDSMAGLVAEVLADAVEFKFLLWHPERKKDLMSSSFFKDQPAKLDLTLYDLAFYFELATSGFQTLWSSKKSQDQLLKAYLSKRAKADPTVVRQVIERVAGAIHTWFKRHFEPEIQFETSSEGLFVNVFSRIALNYLSFQSVLNAQYQVLAQAWPPRQKQGALQGFADLMILSTASFYELNRREHFWHIDEWLAYGFQPFMTRWLSQST